MVWGVGRDFAVEFYTRIVGLECWFLKHMGSDYCFSWRRDRNWGWEKDLEIWHGGQKKETEGNLQLNENSFFISYLKAF